MINDEAKDGHYSAVKNLIKLTSWLRWLRSKKEATINDNNSLQNAPNDALNYQTIEAHPERISKIKSYIIKYNLEGIKFPAWSKDWKKFKQNNKTVDLNILFVPHNTEIIRVAYRSEYNHKRKNQVNLLMITDGAKWHYLAIKNLSALLEGKSSNHHGDFYCLSCFNSYSSKNMKKYLIITTDVVHKCQSGLKKY